MITVLQTSDHHQVIADHGITRDTWLRAIAGRTGADAGMLLAAAERLADMPAVSAWFHQGILSWGAVRQIVTGTRTLTAAQRSWVDAALAEGDGIHRLDGDQVAAAVDGLVNRIRPDLHRDRDATAVTRRWLTIQPRADGTAAIHGSLDPETAAAAFAAFTTTPAHHDWHHTDDPDDDADAVNVVDLSVLDPDNPANSGTARLHWATDRAPVELTPAAAQRLACDATMRVVIPGAEILGVTAAHPKVSATLRTALVVRDGGCRFPTCHQPVELCDNHHIIPVDAGGPTCLANLALICRDHHHAIHDSNWRVTLHDGRRPHRGRPVRTPCWEPVSRPGKRAPARSRCMQPADAR